MAAGVPVIAKAIGANFRIIQDNYNGFLVKENSEWISCIKKLAGDEVLRKRIGQQAAEEVEKKFSIIANKDTYLGIIQNAIQN